MTHPLVYNPHYHTAQIFLSMVESLAQPRDRLPALAVHSPPLADLPLGSFTPEPEEVEATAALIRELTGCDEVPPLVLLNANCSDLLPIRKWEPENYVALGKRLIGKYPGVHVAFTGAPAEAPLAEELIGRIGSDRCVSLAGKTTLRSLLVAYHLADLLVTNDSGPAHFASLTPIDVITLFGPETPELFSPPSPRSHVMWSAIACSPCVNAYNNRLSRCHDNLCMQLITVDQVLEKACEVLEARRGATALA
jgi:ADP-heptose:LPS heptosyltransferase